MHLRYALPLSAALWAGAAHAALFDDNEARRQITELKTQLDSSQKSIGDRLAAIEAKLSQSDTAGQNRALDLAQLLDGLKQDLAKLRGQIEVLANQADNLDRRQKDLYADLDTRLRKLEQTQTQLQDKVTQGERDVAAEKQAYETALNQFKVGNYQLSITGFQGFLSNYPSSQLAANAQYWIGNAYLQMRDYKSAIAAQQKVVSIWPDNPKAADALLNIAIAQSEMGDARAERKTLNELVKKYPDSSSASQAKQRLAKKTAQ
jgi:tol-pal system protein YbgF